MGISQEVRVLYRRIGCLRSFFSNRELSTESNCVAVKLGGKEAECGNCEVTNRKVIEGGVFRMSEHKITKSFDSRYDVNHPLVQ